MASILPADPTLDEIRAALAPLIAASAAFDGFGDAALADAAARVGVDPDVARLAFPGGPRDLVDAWFADIDMAMEARWRSEEHTSELQSLMRISYAVLRLKKKTHITQIP